MPLICEFFGIKISMFWNEHIPPHFQAGYGDFRVLISISDAAVIKGALPLKAVETGFSRV